MTAEIEKFQGMAVSGSIQPWIDLAKERGMTEHRVFQNLLKAFERMKAGTITEEESQAAMQAFIDACSAKDS
jgi:tRNA U55 pseudouridine synthase TruB